jgi:hypothetical protein
VNEPLITGILQELQRVDQQIDALYEYRSALALELEAAEQEPQGDQA